MNSITHLNGSRVSGKISNYSSLNLDFSLSVTIKFKYG